MAYNDDGYYDTLFDQSDYNGHAANLTPRIVTNAHARLGVEAPVIRTPIESVASRREADRLLGSGSAGGEIVAGTDLRTTPTDNAGWIGGMNQRFFGRSEEGY